MPDAPEFEFEQTDVPSVVVAFEAWLNKLSLTDDGLTVGNLDNLFQVIYFRMRPIYTPEQMHVRLHALMAQGEYMIKQPGFIHDEKGNPASPILRENFQDTTDEEYHRMLEAQANPITEEALATELTELLDEESS